MHELSLCSAIADIVERNAPDQDVRSVSVQVGRFRQVVPDTLRYCWEMVTFDTRLADTALLIDEVAAVIVCRVCGARTELELPVFVCSACGSSDAELVSGEEFLVTTLELAEN